jgi:hypothetical protein
MATETKYYNSFYFILRERSAKTGVIAITSVNARTDRMTDVMTIAKRGVIRTEKMTMNRR